jgi:hypothetical protein
MTLHLPLKEQKNQVFQGIQKATDLRARMEVEGLIPTSDQSAIQKVLGKRFKIDLNVFDIFSKIGPIYPKALRSRDLVIELRFATSKKIVRGSSAGKIKEGGYGYKLSDVMFEWDEFCHPYFASQMTAKYNALNLKYRKMWHPPVKEIRKDETLVNIRFGAPGESIIGFLILMVDDTKRCDFNYQNKEYYAPQMESIAIHYKGSGHQLYVDGMLLRDTYDSMLKLYPDTDIGLGEFHTKHFGLWLDTRLSSKNELHGGGYTFRVGDEINIAIKKPKDTAEGGVSIYVYVIQDETLIDVGGKFVEVSP